MDSVLSFLEITHIYVAEGGGSGEDDLRIQMVRSRALCANQSRWQGLKSLKIPDRLSVTSSLFPIELYPLCIPFSVINGALFLTFSF